MTGGEGVDLGNLKRVRRHKPVYVQVVEQIQEMLRNGELAPGDQLLPERELAEKIGVSRTSIRQSLAVLDGMGLIEITPRDGAYVRRQSLEGAVEPLTQILFQSREKVKHMFEVRQIIETQAVRLAALRRDNSDLERLCELNRQFESDLREGDMAFEANKLFHLAIVETAKNPLLIQIMCTLLTATMEVYISARQRSFSGLANRLRFVEEHRQVIEAITEKESELAVHLIEKHIDDARRRVEEVMNSPNLG